MTITTVAVLGANSQIAQDYIEYSLKKSDRELYLFSRKPEQFGAQVPHHLKGRAHSVGYDHFGLHRYDLVINFVGASNPEKISAMGHDIFNITGYYDALAIEYLKRFDDTFYVFISSGSAYGDVFSLGPASDSTQSIFKFNSLPSSQYYGASKYLAEKSHRALTNLKILDLRIFSYFSKNQDLTSTMLISDIIRSIKTGGYFKSNNENIYRDYVGIDDFYHLIECVSSVGGVNASVDSYSLGPIGKIEMLNHFRDNFGLNFLLEPQRDNQPSIKKYYYSLKKQPLIDLGYIPKLNSLQLLDEVCHQLL